MTGNAQFREIENLKREMGRLQSRLSLLSAQSIHITSSLDLPTVLQKIVDAACQLCNAKYGAIGVFDTSGQISQFITHGVTDEEKARIGSLPKGMGILGFLHSQQEPMRLADLSKHVRSVGFPPYHPPMKTFLGSPIKLGNEILGNLYLTEKVGGGEFMPEDQDLLVLFAAQAALAIRNADLHSKLSKSASEVENERQRFERLVETTPVGVMVVDADTLRISYINPEIESIFRISVHAGDTLANLNRSLNFKRQDSHSLTANETPIMRALLGENVQAEKVRLEFMDGRSVPILMNARPVIGSDEKIHSAIVTIQNISALEEQERIRNEFAVVIAASDDAIIGLATDGIITAWNAGAEKLFGYKPEEVIGDLFEVLLPSDIDEFSRILTRILRGESIPHYETERMRKDGTRIWVSEGISAVRSDEGEISGAIVIANDITAQKIQAEALIDSEKRALAGRFAAMIAHEINNPLEAIKNALHLIGTHDLTSLDAKLLDIAERERKRIGALVRKFTSLYEPTSNLSYQDINSIVDEVISLIQHEFVDSNIAIVKELDPSLPKILASPDHLRQVILNILLNSKDILLKSKDAANRRQLKVVTCRPRPEDVELETQSFVLMETHLPAGAIPASSWDKMFNPLFNSKEGGLGLGVWIGKGIVENLGGRLLIRTKEEEKIFVVALPTKPQSSQNWQ